MISSPDTSTLPVPAAAITPSSTPAAYLPSIASLTPSVWRRIARKEAHDLYRDGRVRWAMVAITLMMLVCAALSWQDYQQREISRHAVGDTTRQQWEQQGEKNPHSAAHFGQYAFTPESPSAVFDPGTLAQTGTAVWLEPHRRNTFRYRQAAETSAAVRYGLLTPAFVLQALAPLLILIAAFSAVAGERENGTLRLLLSLGVPRRDLFLGKASGVALACAPVLALALLLAVGLACIQERGAALAFSDQFIRLAGMTLAYTAYALVWIFIALGVSARVHKPHTALAVLLCLWMTASLLAPRLGALLAERLEPAISAEKFSQGIKTDLAQGLDGQSPPEKRYQDLVAATLAQYNVKTLDDLPVGFRGLQLRAGDAYSEQVHDKHFNALHAQWQHQAQLQLLGAIAGPLPALQAVSQAFAGTDVHHHIHFSQQVELYRRSFINRTSDEITHLSKGEASDAKSDNALWQSIKPLHYAPPTASEALRYAALAVLVLLVWLLGAGLWAYQAFQRIDFE